MGRRSVGASAAAQTPKESLPPVGPVMSVLLWREPARSAVALVAGMVVLISMLYFSLISVFAYLALSLLAVTLGFRVYGAVRAAVQKTDQAHPFQDLLSIETTIESERAHQWTDKVLASLNCSVTCLRDLFLVKDLFESLKFGLALYLFTYLGAWFNTMTLVIMGYVVMFTAPKIYELNKTQIDEVLAKVQAKIGDLMSKVKTVIPLGSKTEAPVEKKEE